MSQIIRILGIDPGSVTTGYGIIESDGMRSRHITHGHIKVKGETLPDKLGIIFSEITAIIAQWQPQEMAIENVFISKNAQSALKLGQARGAAICAAVHCNLDVSEYSPRSIKQAIAGTGSASKEQIQHMVGVLLNIKEAIQADAADGLAIGLCHAHSRNNRRWQSAIQEV